MSEKVLLILVDGMRPDSLEGCGHPFIEQLKETSSYTAEAQTVMPSVTLPCHMSLFHSVAPNRHGILTNTYVPQVRPINGLLEQLSKSDIIAGFFYNWEELRDCARPDSLACSYYVSGRIHTYEVANRMVTDKAIAYVNSSGPDFTFLYLGLPDHVGHAHGWMSAEYMASVSESWDCIENIARSIPDDYTIMITADHGGHGRSHGSDSPEDMTIPLFLKGKAFGPDIQLKDVSIIDLAPTIAKLLGVPAADEWEGKPLI